MKKSFMAAVVFAGASFAVPGVWAQTGSSSAPQALELVDNSAFFGDSFEAGNRDKSFADRFTFNVTGSVGQNRDAIVAPASRSAEIGRDITSFWLFGGNDTVISEGTSMETGATDVWTVADDNLATGDYYLRVNGTIVADEGASFGGAMMLVPVPEPGAYAMMLGGLGILGFLARRGKARRN